MHTVLFIRLRLLCIQCCYESDAIELLTNVLKLLTLLGYFMILRVLVIKNY